jgi:hypothetical protein
LTLTNSTRTPLANKPVDVLVRPNRATPWRLYRRTQTDAAGAVLLNARLLTTTDFALRYAGEAGIMPLAAGGGTVRVTARVTASMRPVAVRGRYAVRRGTRVTLTGIVGPNKRSQPVYLQRLVGTVWRNVTVTKLGQTSNYGFVLPTGLKGTTSYRVLRPADTANSSGMSAVYVLTVT